MWPFARPGPAGETTVLAAWTTLPTNEAVLASFATLAGLEIEVIPRFPQEMPGGTAAAERFGGLSMVEGLFSGTNYLAAKRLLDATALRQEAIAGNLANVETPGYRRMDVSPSFEAELKQAIGSGDVAAMKTTQPKLAIDATARSSRQDGNTVILESELLKLNQNSVEHAMETQMITGNLMRMRLAITGRG